MSSIPFAKQFLRHPTQTGAIAPSSEELAELIVDCADLNHASTIIEWGPGTGVFTEKILQRKRPEAVFFAMEMNADFVALTQARCPDVEIYHDSATETRTYLRQHGRDHCDVVICGLPWASFDNALQDALIETLTTILGPGGRFLTFAYLQGLLLPAGRRFRKTLRSRFPRVTTTRTVWRNLPPAFAYVATGESTSDHYGHSGDLVKQDQP